MSKKPLKKIPLGELTVGMHIAKLDISWVDSPFMTHSRLVKSDKDIALLKKAGAKIIVIDPNKGLDTHTHQIPEKNIPKETKVDDTPTEKVEEPSAQKDLEPKEKILEKEIAAAINLRSQVKKAITNLHNDLSAGNAIKTEAVSPLIEQTLESLARHNQALLNLAHMSRRAQKLADHTFSTFCLSLNIAQQISLPENHVEALGIAALVHEAGWAQIPMALMGKRTSYSSSEKKLIEKHPELGIKALAKSELPDLVTRIVSEHHELCNGQGYPKKLKGEQMHPLSRLFAVVDRYDELVHQLNDKPGMLPTYALRDLYVSAQKKIYDEDCVAQLISLLGVYPVSSAVKLSDGSFGIVRDVPPDNHLLPLVEIRVDEAGKVLDTPVFIDLADAKAQSKPITIESVIDPNKNTDANAKRLVLDI